MNSIILLIYVLAGNYIHYINVCICIVKGEISYIYISLLNPTTTATIGEILYISSTSSTNIPTNPMIQSIQRGFCQATLHGDLQLP